VRRCDETSLPGLLQAYQGLDVPPVPLPRFPHQAYCLAVHDSCPGFGALTMGVDPDTNLPGQSVSPSVNRVFPVRRSSCRRCLRLRAGAFPSFSTDGMRASMLFADPTAAANVLQLGWCNYSSVAPAGQPDTPAQPTLLDLGGGLAVPLEPVAFRAPPPIPAPVQRCVSEAPA